MEISKKFCENCKRDISVSNFELHIVHCKRNIKLCDLCNEPITASRFKTHLDEDHAMEPCSKCEITLEKWMLPKHQASCPRRLVSCEFCEAEIFFNEYGEHKDFCGSRTEKCRICQKYIMLKDKETHSQESCQKLFVSCEFCKDEIYFSEYDEHKDFCGSKTEKCGLCHKYIMLKDKETHSQESCQRRYEMYCSEYDEYKDFNGVWTVKCNLCHKYITAKEKGTHSQIHNSKNSVSPIVEQNSANEYNRNLSVLSKSNEKLNSSQSTPKKDMQYSESRETSPEKSENFTKHYGLCHICKQYVPWVDMNVHVPTCATVAGKCSLCGENVPEGTIKEHMQKYCNNLSETASPKRCDSAAQKTRINGDNRHSYSLGHKNYKETEPRHPIGGAVSLHSKPEASFLCPLCQISFSRAKIKAHIATCNADDVPSAEMENHLLSCHEVQDERNHGSRACRQNDHDVVSKEASTEASVKSCPFCHQSCSSDHILDHIRKCPKNMFECSFCGDKVPEKDKGIHEGFYCKAFLDERKPSNSQVPTYAETVKKIPEFGDSFSIFGNGEFCPVCHCKVPTFEMNEHLQNCQNSVKPCRFCWENILVEFEEQHLNVCPKVHEQSSSKHQYSTSNEYQSVGAVPKRKNKAKQALWPCALCNETYNKNILPLHEKNCGNQLVKCPECGDVLKRKIFARHAEFRCARTSNKGNKRSGNKQPPEPSAIEKVKNLFGFGQSDSKHRKAPHPPGVQQAPPPSYWYHREDGRKFEPKAEHSGWPYDTSQDSFQVPEPVLIPCEICGKPIPADDIILHTTGCAPELVSGPKRNIQTPRVEEKSYSSYSEHSSFFEGGKTPSAANKKQIRTKNNEHGALPGEYISYSKDDEYTNKYLGSDVNSVWGTTVESGEEISEQSSDEGKPEYTKDNKTERRGTMLKSLAMDSDEEMQSCNTSINKKDLARNEKRIKSCEKIQSSSKSPHRHSSSSDRINHSSNEKLDSDHLDEEMNREKVSEVSKNVKPEKRMFENSRIPKGFISRQNDNDKHENSSIKSVSDKKNSRNVNQDSEEEDMEWNECPTQDIIDWSKFAVQEKLHLETIPVKTPNMKSKDHLNHSDVVHDRRSLEERVHDSDNEVQRNKLRSRSKADEQELPLKIEFSVYEPSDSVLSEDGYVGMSELSNSKFGVIGQNRKISGKMLSKGSLIQRQKESALEMESGVLESSRIHENRETDVFLQKQEIKSEMVVKESFSKNLSKDCSEHLLYSNKSLGKEGHDNYKHSVYSDEVDENHSFSEADMTQSRKARENRKPEVLQQKQNMKIEVGTNKSLYLNSEDNQRDQHQTLDTFEDYEYEENKCRKDYKESVTQDKNPDIENSALKIGPGVLRSCKAYQSGETDVLSRKHAFKMEVHVNKPFSMRSTEGSEMYQQFSSTVPEDSRSDSSRNKVPVNDNKHEKQFPSKTEPGIVGVLDKNTSDILKQMQGVTNKISASEQSSFLEEYYIKHQYPFSKVPDKKRFEDNQVTGVSREASTENRNQNKLIFSKESEHIEHGMDALTILQQKQANRTETDFSRPHYRNSADDNQTQASFIFPEIKGLVHGKYRKSPEEYLTEIRSRDKTLSNKANENEELDMDAVTTLQLKQNMSTDINVNQSLSKTSSAGDHQKYRSRKVVEMKEIEDKKNRIHSREFLNQDENRGYEKPAFSVEAVTDISEQNMAKEKTFHEIIGSMKESLESAKLALGRNDDQRRDIDDMISEHERRIKAWKWRNPQPPDSEEEL